MFSKLSLSFILITSLYSADNLGTIKVNDKKHQNPYDDIFSEPDYIERQNFVPDPPLQKRLTIKEAMNIPGIQGDPIKGAKLFAGVTSAGRSGKLLIQGSDAREGIATMNYLPLGYLFHLRGLHSVISPEASEQLDIYLGGFDATYNNVMGSVLDVTPKYPNGDNSGFLHLGVFDSSFGYDFKISEKMNGYIGARRSYVDLFYDQLVAKGKQNSELSFVQFPNYADATLFLTYNEENHLFTFESIAAQDDLIANNSIKDNTDPLINSEVALDQGFITYGLRWIYDDGEYSANTLLYQKNEHTNTDIFNKFHTYKDNQTSGLFHISTQNYDQHKLSYGGHIFESLSPIDYYVANVSSDDDPNPLNFTLSEQLDNEIVDLKYTNTKQYTASFIEDIYQYSDALKFRMGLNTFNSDVNTHKIKVDPRFSTSYTLNDYNNIGLSIGKYSQLPAENQQIEHFRNPTVYDEYSIHYSLHYQHHFRNNYTLEIEPFYRSFHDLVIRDSEATYINKGSGEAKGFDLSLFKKEDALFLYTTYSYVETARQTSTSNTTMYKTLSDIPHTLQVVTSYHFSSNIIPSLLLQYQSGRPYTPRYPELITENEQEVIKSSFGERNSKRLPEFFTLNLKIAYTQTLDTQSSLEYSFELTNATNHLNVHSALYDEKGEFSGYNYQFPRIPWFDITYRF
jgi:hypothetical protein